MKKLLFGVLFLAVAGFFLYNFVYKSHRDIRDEKAEFTVNASDLVKEFLTNRDSSSKKYLNKTIIVTGKLSEIEVNSLMLNEATYCTFDTNHNIPEADLNSQYSIKGRCLGYDELLEIVKLDQASIVE